MSMRIVLLIAATVGLSALAQIVMKSGMSSTGVQSSLSATAGRLDAAVAIATQPAVILGIAMYALASISWLLVLARLDVSAAYPFLGIAFLLTMLLGWLILGEDIGWQRAIGTVLISIGVVLVARTT